jgi:hypothetical protein
LAPVKYFATLLGQADEVVLRWFMLVVALLLDLAAVLLLLAATRTRARRQTAQGGRSARRACRGPRGHSRPVGKTHGRGSLAGI